jgi:hypothetical protein
MNETWKSEWTGQVYDLATGKPVESGMEVPKCHWKGLPAKKGKNRNNDFAGTVSARRTVTT